jgi:hypothetical protein
MSDVVFGDLISDKVDIDTVNALKQTVKQKGKESRHGHERTDLRYVSTELENHNNGGFWNEGQSIFQRIFDACR